MSTAEGDESIARLYGLEPFDREQRQRVLVELDAAIARLKDRAEELHGNDVCQLHKARTKLRKLVWVTVWDDHSPREFQEIWDHNWPGVTQPGLLPHLPAAWSTSQGKAS